jgi:hypothetical protein
VSSAAGVVDVRATGLATWSPGATGGPSRRPGKRRDRCHRHLPRPSFRAALHRLTGAFLAGYRNANTRASYLQQLHRWFAWCTGHQLDPRAIERTHIELHQRWFERQVGSINTVCHGLSVLASVPRLVSLDRSREKLPSTGGP